MHALSLRLQSRRHTPRGESRCAACRRASREATQRLRPSRAATRSPHRFAAAQRMLRPYPLRTLCCQPRISPRPSRASQTPRFRGASVAAPLERTSRHPRRRGHPTARHRDLYSTASVRAHSRSRRHPPPPRYHASTPSTRRSQSGRRGSLVDCGASPHRRCVCGARRAGRRQEQRADGIPPNWRSQVLRAQ